MEVVAANGSGNNKCREVVTTTDLGTETSEFPVPKLCCTRSCARFRRSCDV